MSYKILIVEDDAQQARLLAEQMAGRSHQPVIAKDGQAALMEITKGTFDVLILDRMLPNVDGVSVIQALRSAGIGIPTLMLTALGQTDDRISGLDAGADDYLVKPADADELHARIHALVRARQWQSGTSDTIDVGDIRISPVKFRAWRDGKDLSLPRIEFLLLLEFARNPGAVLTRSMLIERVWKYEFEPATNIVDVYIRRLRLKLTQFGHPDPIVTARGTGYMLQDA